MKKSEEILNVINTKKIEVEGLKNEDGRFVGENLKKAQDKIKEINDLKDEYEVQKNLEDMSLEDVKDNVSKNEIKDVKVNGKGNKKVNPNIKNVAFVKALLKRDMSNEEKTEIKNMLVEGDKTKGGLLVPQDLRTAIIELQRNQFDIRPYITVEPVNTLSGSRNVEDEQPQAAGFASVDEGAEIQALHEPDFKELDYVVRKYAGTIPLTDELLNDTPENVLAYIQRWMAKNELNTYNYQIFNGSGTKAAQGIMSVTSLQETADFTGTATASIKALKTVLNKDFEDLPLDGVKIYTNGSGYEFIDELEDKQGHPYLQPDPTMASGFRFLGHELVKVPSKFLADVTAVESGSSVTRTPFVIGDLIAAYTMFDRQQLSVASTNIGGDAFDTDTTKVRGIFRFDGKLKDTGAIKVLMAKLA
ncbi:MULTISPECIES: phage major capsid protein [Clostridium]|uniref:phage major capsid protein n=1 Tax=Clostridium TaxID=1485 RepID=UPI000825D767|nr:MULTISPECIES: phage major capsid protein [Clostridium]PJI09975.1 phage major capsid protein [Clostridium sp. CT7]